MDKVEMLGINFNPDLTLEFGLERVLLRENECEETKQTRNQLEVKEKSKGKGRGKEKEKGCERETNNGGIEGIEENRYLERSRRQTKIKGKDLEGVIDDYVLNYKENGINNEKQNGVSKNSINGEKNGDAFMGEGLETTRIELGKINEIDINWITAEYEAVGELKREMLKKEKLAEEEYGDVGSGESSAEGLDVPTGIGLGVGGVEIGEIGRIDGGIIVEYKREHDDIWLPARLHPEISPAQYSTWIEKYGGQIKKMKSKRNKRRSRLGTMSYSIESLEERESGKVDEKLQLAFEEEKTKAIQNVDLNGFGAWEADKEYAQRDLEENGVDIFVTSMKCKSENGDSGERMKIGAIPLMIQEGHKSTLKRSKLINKRRDTKRSEVQTVSDISEGGIACDEYHRRKYQSRSQSRNEGAKEDGVAKGVGGRDETKAEWLENTQKEDINSCEKISTNLDVDLDANGKERVRAREESKMIKKVARKLSFLSVHGSIRRKSKYRSHTESRQSGQGERLSNIDQKSVEGGDEGRANINKTHWFRMRRVSSQRVELERGDEKGVGLERSKTLLDYFKNGKTGSKSKRKEKGKGKKREKDGKKKGKGKGKGEAGKSGKRESEQSQDTSTTDDDRSDEIPILLRPERPNPTPLMMLASANSLSEINGIGGRLSPTMNLLMIDEKDYPLQQPHQLMQLQLQLQLQFQQQQAQQQQVQQQQPPLQQSQLQSQLQQHLHQLQTQQTPLIFRRLKDAFTGNSKVSTTNSVQSQPSKPPQNQRYPIQVERAIYKLASIKLANTKRPLHQQVLLTNMMFWYLEEMNNSSVFPYLASPQNSMNLPSMNSNNNYKLADADNSGNIFVNGNGDLLHNTLLFNMENNSTDANSNPNNTSNRNDNSSSLLNNLDYYSNGRDSNGNGLENLKNVRSGLPSVDINAEKGGFNPNSAPSAKVNDKSNSQTSLKDSNNKDKSKNKNKNKTEKPKKKWYQS